MRKKFKKGAASFYIVAFSTLILVVIATSFAMVVTSEIARTSNDDLSQSAYDSSLAGVEDAKVAYSNYRRCAEAGAKASSTRPSGIGTITCADIMYWMEHPDCYMVGHILGKIPKDAGTDTNTDAEVTVGGAEVSGSKDTTTNQAYTCVMINTNLYDYRTTLTANKRIQTMRASAETPERTNAIDKIKISWYSVRNDVSLKFTNFNGRVVFPAFGSSSISVPPTVELQIVQTGTTFTMADFDKTTPTQTDRGTLYLVPTDNHSAASVAEAANYWGVYNGSTNLVSASQVIKTNDRTIKNKAFLVYCDPDSIDEFYCSVEVEVPRPIGGTRHHDTFMISVSLPYQQPDTDFSIELICSGEKCGDASPTLGGETGAKPMKISNSQIAIDSTGRANDLYRRVETRLETADTTFTAGYPYYALQVLGDQGVHKEMKVSKEVGFYF